MSNLSAKRIGELGLHIFSFEEMPREEWIREFKSIEELDHAMDDREGYLARTPADSKEILQILSDRKQAWLNDSPPATEGVAAPQQVVVSQEAVQRGTFAPVQQAPAPNVVHAMDAVVSSRIETIITDKGVFFHIDALKERLSAFTTDEQLFMKACAEAGVDIFTEYVSEAAKKKIAKAVQDLTKAEK